MNEFPPMNAPDDATTAPSFTVGQWVSVASRTTPGINQPGGIGRITAVNNDAVSVKYVLDGRHERHVPEQYVQLYLWEEAAATNRADTRLRDRTMLLGRCTYCGSLRADCQSCDISGNRVTSAPSQRRATVSSSSSLIQPSEENSSNDDHSSSDSAYERMMQSHRREYKRYKRSVRRAAARNDPVFVRDAARKTNYERKNGTSVLATVGTGNASESESSSSLNHHPMVHLASDTSDDSEEDNNALDRLPLAQLTERARQRSIPQDPSFIQPEGDANQLPKDVLDLTAICTYPQLVPLLDELLERMETLDIPQAKREFLQFERAFQESQQNPVSMVAHANTLLMQSEAMHDALVQTLIRNGFDQCQCALRKLTSRRFYKQYVQQEKDSEHSRVPFMGNHVDVRELRLDALGQAAEEILSQLRHFSNVLKREHCKEEEEDASVDLPSAAESQNSSLAFHQQLLASQTALPPPPLYSLDRHPHARRKRNHRHRRFDQRRAKRTKPPRPVAGEQPCDGQPENPSMNVYSDDSLLSEDEVSQHSSASSSFYQQLLASQPLFCQPQLPTTSKFYPDAVGLKKRRRHYRNRNQVPETKRMSGRKFQTASAEEPSDEGRFPTMDTRMQDITDYDVEYGTDASVSSDLNGNGTARLLQERSNAWRYKRQRDVLGKSQTKNRTSSKLVTLSNDENHPGNIHTGGYSVVESAAPIVPEIETLLPSSSLNETGPKRMEGSRRNTRSTTDRMEEWLESNVDITNLSNHADSDDSLDHIQSIRRRNVTERRKHQSIPISISPNSMRATQATLFSSLGKDRSSNAVFNETDLASISDMKSYCRNMVCIQSSDLLSKELNSLCLYFENDNDHSTSDAPFAFHCLVDLLRKDDMCTLQYLVTTESPNLCRFVSVVVALLRLIRCKANKQLTFANDGVVFDIFSEDRYKGFLDLVVLQLVDTLLSIFHPLAWDLRIRNTQYVLEHLKPLRNELAQHFDLVERACQSLSSELKPQEWRCVREGDGIYISSVHPDEWRTLLVSGASAPKSTTARYSAFEDVYPRCEVDAIWCLIGFLAGSPAVATDSTDFVRWNFLSQLLVKGSLTISNDSDRSPPSEDQIEAAIEDLTNLTALISSGALGNPPRRDTYLVDLIQRCVSLECDVARANDFSWKPLHPCTKQEPLITKISGLFQEPTSNGLNSRNSSVDAFLSFLRDLSAPELEMSWMNHPFLLPSSRLLRCCLSLLLAWKSQISHEKVKRLQCLENVIKALVKSLTSDDSEAQPTSRENDAFLDAFGSTSNEECITESRPLLVRTEIAAYISVFALFVFNSDSKLWSGLNQQVDVAYICELLWNVVSDAEMRERRNLLSSGGLRFCNIRKFKGDQIRLYFAAKVMAFFGIVAVGIHPLSCDGLFSSTFAGQSTSSARTRLTASSSVFLASTLIACLDCFCDSKYKAEVLSSIVLCTMVSFTLIYHVSDNVDDSSLVDFDRMGRRSYIQFIGDSNVLQKSFYFVFTAQASGFEDILCFQSVVLAIRYILTFYPKEPCNDVPSSLGAIETAGSGDDFGDIDDSLLANLDLGQSTEGTIMPKYGIESIHSIFNLLADALLSSKPSSRNSRCPTKFPDNENVISVHGMKLVSNHLELICTVLSEIAVTRWYPSCTMKPLWKVCNRFSFSDDQDDSLYFKDLGIRISRHICQFYESVVVQRLVSAEGESVLFNFLEATLNHKVLRRIPSCNLDRICSNSGSIAEEQGFGELFNFKSGDPKRLRSSLMDVRLFCHNTSRALFPQDENSEVSPTAPSIGRILLNFSSELNPTQLVPSLEREIFDRFMLFQELLIRASTQESDIVSFERLSSLLMASCSSELINLLQRIGIQDKAYADVRNENYGHAKLFETVACLSELLVNLISETIRCHCCLQNFVSADGFESMLRYISDHFIAPLLSGRPVQLLTLLRAIVLSCSSFLNGQKPGSGRVGNLGLSNVAMERYCDLLRNAFIRRSREFVLSIASSPTFVTHLKSSKLLNSILAVGTSHSIDVATFVARCFCRSDFYNEGKPSIQENIMCSPLEHVIDEHYGHMERSSPLDAHHSNALRTLKRFALQDFAVSKLVSPDSTSKVLLLRLVQSMLDQESNELFSCEHLYLLFDPFLLCSIAKGIGMAFRSLLESNTISDCLVAALYSCARSLMNLPTRCLISDAVGWLVDWAYPSTVETSNTIHSNYLWYSWCWMRDVGVLILEEKSLQQFRDPTRTAGLTSPWLPLVDSESSVSIVSRHLNDLEPQIFPELDSAARNGLVINKYKASGKVRLGESTVSNKASKYDEGVPMDEWQPSMDVRYSIHQFMEKMKFAAPTR